MKIALLAVEFFGANKFGGFGKATRLLGAELARRGHRVTTVVPRRAGEPAEEWIDGIRVRRFPAHRPDRAHALVEEIGPDICHSQEPSTLTWIAQRAAPSAAHMVTSRDPRRARDWWVELSLPSVNYLQVLTNAAWEDNPLVHRAVRRADLVACASRHLVETVENKYRLSAPPLFLPTPIRVPDAVTKSERPTICFVSRFDRRKRPRLFLDLAHRFPDVRFIAVGASRDEAWDAALRSEYHGVPNLEFTGFINQFASDGLSRVYERSWVLVNTAAREGLPNAFLEAAAHGCAIVSAVDPQHFTTRFGEVASGDDFAGALGRILERDRWREQGSRGRDHVRAQFGIESAVTRHLDHYARLLGRPASATASPAPG